MVSSTAGLLPRKQMSRNKCCRVAEGCRLAQAGNFEQQWRAQEIAPTGHQQHAHSAGV